MANIHLLQHMFLGNTIYNYLIAASIFAIFLFIAIIVKILTQNIFMKFAKQTSTHLDEEILTIIGSVGVFILVLGGIYFGLRSLSMPGNVWHYSEKIIQTIFIIRVFQGITHFSDFIIENYIQRLLRSKKDFDLQLTRLITRIFNIAIWVIGISIILQVFGYNISAIITGLGIGGLAIALAAQDTLGNFFSSISIIADRPYKIGDIVKFQETEGIIKDIGLRTTRIETFFGTIVSIPNNNIAKAAVENMSKRNTRRYDGAVGLIYGTSSTKVKKALAIIRDILKNEKNITNEFRAFFTTYDSSSLRIEFTYYVKDPKDYILYLRTINDINMAIKKEFEKEGIEIAFPTQTIHLKQDNKRSV